MYQLYVGGQVNPEGFGKFYKPLEERRAQLAEEIPRLQAHVDVLKINCLSCDQIMSEARDLYTRWPRLEFEEKHRVVESVTEKIVVGKDEISIHLYHLPSSEELTKEQRKLRPPSRSTKTPIRT